MPQPNALPCNANRSDTPATQKKCCVYACLHFYVSDFVEWYIPSCTIRGKHTLWEGGVRGTALIHSQSLLPLTKPVNFTSLMHVSDWLPTILSATLLPTPKTDYQFDGVSQWDAIVSASKGVAAEGRRQEVLIFWDPLPIAFNGNVGDSPKSSIRVGQFKLILGPPGCVSRAELPFTSCN